MLDVQLGGLRGVMRGMVKMALRGVRVVRRRFMVVSFVMYCGFAMVPSRMLMMFGRFVVMFCRLLGHESSSLILVNGAALGCHWQDVACSQVH
jgi:hypothetical protein